MASWIRAAVPTHGGKRNRGAEPAGASARFPILPTPCCGGDVHTACDSPASAALKVALGRMAAPTLSGSGW